MRSNAFRLLAVFVLILVSASLSVAQTSRGNVTGVVTDSSGAVISNATVKLTQLSTGVVRETTTNGAGIYRFDAVDTGSYDLTVEAQNFKKFTASKFEVAAAAAASVNATLQPGSTSEVVTVEGSGIAALQQTEERRGGSINSIEVRQLPILGQNSLNLMFLLPGIVQSDLGGSLDSGIGAINGARARANNFMIDGTDNNDISVTGPLNRIRNNDAIQEVSIQTSNFSAEFGRAGGAILNQVVKSGTNSLHGTVASVYRYQGFDATQLAVRAGAGPTATNKQLKPSYKENIPAFTVGGPVIIPGLYDGRGKTFWFAAGQWDRFSAGANTSTFSNVPTSASYAVLNALAPMCPNVRLYLDSLQGLTSSAGGTVIDISVPNTATSNVFATTGTCNGTPRTGQTLTFGPANRLFPALALSNNHQVKIDHNPSPKQSMSFRWNWLKSDSGLSTAGISPLFDAYSISRAFNGGFTDTYVFSPRWTNEFRFNYSRGLLDSSQPAGIGLSLPQFVISGVSGFGTSATFPQGRINNNWQYQDTVSWVKGNHSVRMGVDFFRQLAKQRAPFNYRGQISYGGSTAVNGSPNTGIVSGFANFIDDFSGTSGTIAISYGSPLYRPNLFRWAGFIQDSWRVLPNLTLNAGLRYENFGQPANIFTYPAYSGEDPANFAVPSKVKQDNNNFGPSFGFAWTPKLGGLGWLHGDGKMVVRGGYQVSYDTFFNNLLSNMAASAPNAVSNVTLTAAQNNTTPRGITRLNQNVLGQQQPAPLNPLGGSSSQFDPNLVNPYVHRYSLGIQRELPSKMIIDVSYVGALGKKLFQNLNMNPRLPNATFTSTGARLNPAFGARDIRANSGISNYNAMQVEVRRALSTTPVGSVMFTSAYTWSHNIDTTAEVFVTNQQNTSFPAVNPLRFPGALRADYASSDNDRRHVWSSSFVWDIRGPKTGVLGQVLGGWQLTGIIPVSSGQPFTVINGFDRDLDGSSAGDRPDIGNWNAPANTRAIVVPVATCASGLRNPDTNSCTTANDVRFVQVTSYSPTNGNTASRNALVTPGSVTVHTNIVKNFKITERYKLEYRAEIFNLLNNENYNFSPWLSGGASTISVTSAAAGNFINFNNGNAALGNGATFQGTNSPQRNIRMGLKFTF